MQLTARSRIDARGVGSQRLRLPAPAPAAPGLHVAYLLERDPHVAPGLVLDELLELERQGVEVVVIARDGAGAGIEHPAAERLRAPVHALREIEPREDRWDDIAAALLRGVRAGHVHAHLAGWAAGTAMRAA